VDGKSLFRYMEMAARGFGFGIIEGDAKAPMRAAGG
jgi:hypothetical protein